MYGDKGYASDARRRSGREGRRHAVGARADGPAACREHGFRQVVPFEQMTVVAEHLEARGALLRGGTIVDATPIAASPSTKNREGKRDPEMHSSKKGNQWYFGMKVHVGVAGIGKVIPLL